MSLRIFLLLPLLISLCLFAYFSGEVNRSFDSFISQVPTDYGFYGTLLAAILLQIGGHIVRAYKMRFILMQIKESSTRFQFRALTIGYLFNTILPFRLGELIRSRIIASAMKVSFSFAFTLVVFERAVDAVTLGMVGIFLLLVIQPDDRSIFYFPIILSGIGIIALLAIIALALPVQRARGVFYKTSLLFNEQIRDGFRFKTWSVIYGLQRIFQEPTIFYKYALMTISSWLLYVASILLIVNHFISHSGFVDKAINVAAPYFAISVPAGPAHLGAFTTVFDRFVSGHAPPNDSLVLVVIIWSILTIPMTLIGVVLLFFKTRESLWHRLPKSAVLDSEDKLDRQTDISAEMSVFLDNYFSGNTLSKVVHRLEVKGNFRLLKYFRGGSDAITILVSQDGEVIVKKIIPIEFENRLRAQYNWLKQFRGIKGIVEVFEEERTSAYYTIDMSFNKNDLPLFEYIHKNPLTSSERILEDVWSVLIKNVHPRSEVDPAKLHAKNRERYIKKHIYDCLEKAGAVDPELVRAQNAKTLIVNDHEYDNLEVVLTKIRNNRKAWKDIGTYTESPQVHGDVIIDNLLVDQLVNQALIIDPAPDGNIINGKVFDFGKNMQSLYCGYEFLLRDESPVYLRDGNRIDYADLSSAQYAALCDYVRREIAPKYLTESEQRAVIFHAAVLFIRRLKHQVYYTPSNALKFYAVGVKTLNDFLAQYDD